MKVLIIVIMKFFNTLVNSHTRSKFSNKGRQVATGICLHHFVNRIIELLTELEMLP